MTARHAQRADAWPAPRASVDGVVTGGLFLAAFLFFFVSIEPFVDLTDPNRLLPSSGSNLLNQAVVIGLALAFALYAASTDLGRFRILITWPILLLLGWFVATTLVSLDPGLSARRLALTLIVFGIAATVLVLPRDVERFADLIAVAALAILAVSYGGVVFLPDLAIHQASELLEPEHAGHWRGPFTHKNGAGAAMVLVVFMGLYVARRRSRALGWFIAIAAFFFLMRSMAKTSIGLLAPCLILTWLTVSIRRPVLRSLIVPGALALLSLFTVGSVVFAPIQAFNASVMSDPTFTSRTDVWTYATGQLVQRPLLGHGYEAFWGESTFFGEGASWAHQAPDAHNSYLDVLLGTGLPGLCLVLLVLVVQPLRDLPQSERAGNDPATTLFFMRIWTFGLLFAGLESFLFMNGGPVWFLFLVAVFGMRFQAQARDLQRFAP